MDDFVTRKQWSTGQVYTFRSRVRLESYAVRDDYVLSGISHDLVYRSHKGVRPS